MMFLRRLKFGQPDRTGFVEVDIQGTVDPDTFDRLMEIFRSQIKGPDMIVTTRGERYGRSLGVGEPRLEPPELPAPPAKALPPGPTIIEGTFEDE